MMEIGSKIKNARNNAGLTQEKAAEELGVTRQTISNWENNKSYPDIISVIKMSDLYSVSLDHLLKEDTDMKSTYLEHLEESTNVVKSTNRKSRIIVILAYVVVWVIMLAMFWIPEVMKGSGAVDAMGFSILAFYLVLPVATIVTSFFIGKDNSWDKSKWLMLIFYGVMFCLAEYGTFSLLNMVGNEYSTFNWPEFAPFLSGVILSAIGIGSGELVSLLLRKSRGMNKA